MVVVVVTLDGGVLDCAVHPLDLAIRPGMLGFRGAMLDAELRACVFEDMRPDGLSLSQGLDDQGRGRTAGAWRGEVRAVVGQDDADLVGNRFDEMPQELVRRLASRCSSTKANLLVRSMATNR